MSPMQGTFDSDLLRTLVAVADCGGFAKAAVAWGPAPDIPLTVIPTPRAEGTVVSRSG